MTAVLDQTRPAPSPDPQATTQRLRTFRPDVEGLRAVAVSTVVLYHAGVSWLPGGYIGVDVFFVISGFLITGLLLREYERDGRISIADFYARRARRILPLATVVLLATVGASAIELTAARLDSIAHDGLWAAVFGANFRFASSGADYLTATAPPSPLQHFWSLAVEEQFYVMWPLLLWLALHVSRRHGTGKGRAAAITGSVLVASLAWSIVQTSSNANTAYFSPFTRAWELAAGAMVAIGGVALGRLPGWVRSVLGWIGLALIAYSALRFDAATPFPGSAALVPVVGAVCVLVGGLRAERGGTDVLLGRRPMLQIGKYSFSLYLWHWPILIVAEGAHPGLGPGAKVILLGFAFALSALTYHKLENPVRRARLLTTSVRNSLVTGLALILVSLLYVNMYVVGGRYETVRAQRIFAEQNAGLASTGTLASTHDVEAAVAAGARLNQVPATVTPPLVLAAKDVSAAYKDGCLVPAPDVVSPTCVFGDIGASRTVVLFGDSHAAAWMPALQNIATRVSFRLVVLTKGNCPAPDITLYSVELKRSFAECDTWRAWALKQIAQIKPALVVTSSSFHGARLANMPVQGTATQAAWTSGLAKTLATLKAAASRVVVVSDVATHKQPVPTCVAANGDHLKDCSQPILSALLFAHEKLERATSLAAGAQYINARPWFCTSRTCPAVVNGTITDFDENHMTATYSKYLGHALGVALGLEQ